MQLLFISTSLQTHIEPLENSFSDDGVTFYSLSPQELKEYINNLPDIHLNKTAYRLLKPDYFIWLYQQVTKLDSLYQAKKISQALYDETITAWEFIYNFVIENLDSELISKAIDDYTINAQNGFSYAVPIYDPKKEIGRLESPANAKLAASYKESEQLCPNCNAKLSEKEFRIGAITYNCFACNEYCLSIPNSLIKEKNQTTDYKEFAEISWDSEGKKKLSFSRQSEASHSERSSLKKLSLSCNSEKESSELSDLGNLSWSSIVTILNELSNNSLLKKNHFNLYTNVLGYLGFQHRQDTERPNIGKSEALVLFLDSVRNLIRELVELGYYSFNHKVEYA